MLQSRRTRPCQFHTIAFSYFVERQDWLDEAKPVGGISDRENEAIVAIVRSLKRELDELQAEAPTDAKENRGREFFDEIGKRLVGTRVPAR